MFQGKDPGCPSSGELVQNWWHLALAFLQRVHPLRESETTCQVKLKSKTSKPGLCDMYWPWPMACNIISTLIAQV